MKFQRTPPSMLTCHRKRTQRKLPMGNAQRKSLAPTMIFHIYTSSAWKFVLVSILECPEKSLGWYVKRMISLIDFDFFFPFKIYFYTESDRVNDTKHYKTLLDPNTSILYRWRLLDWYYFAKRTVWNRRLVGLFELFENTSTCKRSISLTLLG